MSRSAASAPATSNWKTLAATWRSVRSAPATPSWSGSAARSRSAASVPATSRCWAPRPCRSAGSAAATSATATFPRSNSPAASNRPGNEESIMHARRSAASRIRPLLLTVLLPLSALAAPPAAAGELRGSLAEARAEVRREMATARAELRDENLELGQSLRFRSGGTRSDAADSTGPRGEITPDGELLIDGEAVTVDARQRAQLLAYRNQVIEVALAGMDVGEKAAEVALESVDRSVIGLVFSAMTGRLERQLEQTIRT